MKIRERVLWIDGGAALCAGMVVLVAAHWLQPIYRLPHDLLVFIAVTNLAYATYSLTLANSGKPALIWLKILVIANSVWVGCCVYLVARYLDSASIFGLLHLVLEAVFVGMLALFEWRWRLLITR